jgi:hypothetical protein
VTPPPDHSYELETVPPAVPPSEVTAHRAAMHPLDELALIERTECHQKRPWAFALLLLPLATIIYPPLYDHHDPIVGGIPFFVWYQLLAVAFGGLVTAFVYFLRGTERSVAE